MPTTPSCATITNLLGMGGQYLGSAVDSYLQALGPSVLLDVLPSAPYQSGTISALTILSRASSVAPQYRCVYLRALPSEDLDAVVASWILAYAPGNIVKLVDITSTLENTLQSEVLLIYTTTTEDAFPIQPEVLIRAVTNATGSTIPDQTTGTFTLQAFSGSSPGTVTARNISGMDWTTGTGGYVSFDVLTGEWEALQG